jgi:hypothetical protein
MPGSVLHFDGLVGDGPEELQPMLTCFFLHLKDLLHGVDF